MYKVEKASSQEAVNTAADLKVGLYIAENYTSKFYMYCCVGIV